MSSFSRTSVPLSGNRRLLALVITISVVGPLMSAAPSGQSRRIIEHGKVDAPELRYRALLEQYASGDRQAAIEETLALDVDTVQTMFQSTNARLTAEVKVHKEFSSSTDGRRIFQQMRADRLQVLQLAALLHTDATIVRAKTPEAFDAQQRLAQEAIDQLFALKSELEEFGPVRRPKTVAPPASEEVPIVFGATEVSWTTIRSFVHLWYLVMAAGLQDFSDVERLTPLLREGNSRFRDDPELLLARGSLYELQLVLELVDESLATDIYMPESLEGWRFTLEQARADFASAIRLAPMLLEARLRLGRARLLAGDEDEARREFAIVIANRRAPAQLHYLAHLFAASCAEREQRWADARLAYEQAHQLFPDAQSALLALSRLADRSRDTAGARQWVAQSLAAPSDRMDPWWQYGAGQAHRLEDRLAAFRHLGLE